MLIRNKEIYKKNEEKWNNERKLMKERKGRKQKV